ncbi:aldo/keto reductase [Viridibacillus arvi]|uniref:aldo/keto reductase n=1 Tax=Viridibacillus arvi TaxID=263475 RepID=UPI003D012D4A
MYQNYILKEISHKYNKSIAQIILRWLMKRNVVALTKSSHVERMKENFEIFDFRLSKEDMDKIATLDTKTSLFLTIKLQKLLIGSEK